MPVEMSGERGYEVAPRLALDDYSNPLIGGDIEVTDVEVGALVVSCRKLFEQRGGLAPVNSQFEHFLLKQYVGYISCPVWVRTMAFNHKVDWGNLPCVPLSTSTEADKELPTLGWTVVGEEGRNARIAILKSAKEHNVTLDRLTEILNVRWSHFEEWGAACGKNTILIFVEHLPWKDELLHTRNGAIRAKPGVHEGSSDAIDN